MCAKMSVFCVTFLELLFIRSYLSLSQHYIYMERQSSYYSGLADIYYLISDKPEYHIVFRDIKYYTF